MCFWVFISLASISFISLICGFVFGRELSQETISVENFDDEPEVLVDVGALNLDPKKGPIKYSKEFSYGKQAKFAYSVTYSCESLVRGWRSNNRRNKVSVAAMIGGILGVFLFLGLAFIVSGGMFVIVGVLTILSTIIGLQPFFNGLRKAAHEMDENHTK